jgi:hypothetical protein
MRRTSTTPRPLGLFLALASLAAASTPGEPPPRTTGPDTRGVEAYRVRIVNRYYGAIAVSRDGGGSWERLGRVLRPDPGLLHHIGDREFTAADWAPVGSVAATAVNAIHVKVDLGSDHARVFSLLPAELKEKGPTGSYRDAAASVLTDVPAGTGIFGPEASPRVGSQLMLEEFPSGRLRPWPEGRAPALGDRIVLMVRRRPLPAYVEIENRWAGLVTEVAVDGSSRILGRVYRPLGGSGRFGGTVYQEPGRVRANHPGVLCVSTSPKGVLGGFQVVPAFHANEPTLTYVKSTTAYLVVGPANLDDPGLEGTGPLYLGHFAPGDRVEARIGGVWTDLPVVEMKKASALEVVEALRFYPSQPE